jgi:hypothetical protein
VSTSIPDSLDARPQAGAVDDSTDPDPEVPERPRGPRRYSATYKARILEEYEELDKAGKGALLRHEGPYQGAPPREAPPRPCRSWPATHVGCPSSRPVTWPAISTAGPHCRSPAPSSGLTRWWRRGNGLTTRPATKCSSRPTASTALSRGRRPGGWCPPPATDARARSAPVSTVGRSGSRSPPGAVNPTPYLYGTHPSRSRTERFEWRPVFAVDQLVRRPTPGALVPVEAPDQLPGRTGAATFLDAIRKVARTTVRGRLPAWERPPPDPDRNRRAALTRREGTAARTRTRRAGRMAGRRPSRSRPGELPAWDPEPLEPRDRWSAPPSLLDPACKLTAALGVVVGVDSPPARSRRWTSSTTARCPPGASLAASPPMYPASFRRGLSPSCRPWSRPTRRRRLRRADRYSAEISARCALRS